MQLRGVHAAIRDAVVSECESQALDALAAPDPDDPDEGDTIFAVDRISERALVAHFESVMRHWTHVLIAEGLPRRTVALRSAPTPELAMIVDPIDGTRGLMYQKRSAWILTGVAPMPPYRDAALSDIELALQTEIPLVKQHLCDSLWLVNGVVGGERYDRLTGKVTPLAPRPSRADTLAQGFGGVARFFPGGRDVLAAIDDAVVQRVAGDAPPGRALAFEDQYISTGGQLYELMMGHDRWIADLRPLVPGATQGLCCHPYDLCTESIARAAGVIVSDEQGWQLHAPLDTTTACSWLGFANPALRDLVLPALQDELRTRLRT